ncbi:hypothetical protein ACP70R_039666 [Stipagrostis hirtigluma subsp. patula]
MATTPYFLWAPQASPAAASDSDTAGFAVSSQETPLVAATAAQTALAPSELGAAAVARPRLRRQSSSGSGKQQQQAGGGASKKPPQRGLGVAELERLRCGGDPLRELAAAGDSGAGGLPLLRYHPHHHHLPPASAFDVAPGAHYCSSLLAQPPAPAPPVCFVHAPAAGGQRAPLLAPEQQYFRDRWGRMGGFTPVGNGAGGDHHQATQLPPPPLAPEHPSSQSTIWRPAASSSSSCLHTGHRCDLCSRTVRALAERGAPPPTTSPPSPVVTAGNGNGTVQDYSIYDLAAAMATAGAGQGEAFLARERKRGAAAAEAPAKKEVREIEFFPAAAAATSAHHGGGTGESEFAAPFSSAWYGGAGRSAAAPLDLSLKL